MSNNVVTTKTFKESVKDYLLHTPQSTIAYGIGCAYLDKFDGDRARLKEELLTLETAYKLGFRYFDTSRAYRKSEFVLGEFVPSVPRESLFLATKFRVPEPKDLKKAAEQTRVCLAESLERLKTDHLDLYQVHDSTLELVLVDGGILEVLLEAQRQGLVRYIGVAVRYHEILEQGVRNGNFNTILTYGDFTPFGQSASAVIKIANQHGVGVINASPLMWLHHYHLDLADPANLAAALQFPLTNPEIDITLTGPSNSQEIQASAQALNMPVDQNLWEKWKHWKKQA
jgi:aryl-alcohol dehydrogenase-like predicted oxidoreductase